jgi:hypothetical protein
MIGSRRMILTGYATRTGKSRSAYWVFVAKTEGTRPLGRPRIRWEYNIELDFRDVGGGVFWINVFQDTDYSRGFVNTVNNLRLP